MRTTFKTLCAASCLAFGLVAAGAATAAERPAGMAEISADRLDEARTELGRIQRDVRESLANAALTTDQLSRAYSFADQFIAYYNHQEAQDASQLELTWDEYLDLKLQPWFEQEFALSTGDFQPIARQLTDWRNSARRVAELSTNVQGVRR